MNFPENNFAHQCFAQEPVCLPSLSSHVNDLLMHHWSLTSQNRKSRKLQVIKFRLFAVVSSFISQFGCSLSVNAHLWTNLFSCSSLVCVTTIAGLYSVPIYMLLWGTSLSPPSWTFVILLSCSLVVWKNRGPVRNGRGERLSNELWDGRG